VQHIGVPVPVSLHASLTSAHIAGAGWHVKVWQVRPVSHSESLTQNEPDALALHMPSMQRVKPQQSRSVVHDEPVPWQQRRPESERLHVEPLQHWLPGMMPPSTHERLGPVHMPHAPLWQCSEPSHEPVVEPTSLVQHIIMSVPQSIGVVTHMRIVESHVRPESHVLCGRHGSPMPPIVVSEPHVPPMQVRPPEHELPGAQHGWPMSPHTGGLVHMPPMQRSEPVQPVAPSQHG